MNKYLKFIKLFLMIITLAFTTNVIAADNQANSANNGSITAQEKQDDAEYLFVQTANAGIFEKAPGDNQYKLILKEVDPWVTYFSNVPKRITDFMPIEDFLKLMNKDTKTRYPKGLNTALIILKMTDKKLTRYLISIKDPVYDPDKKILTYTAIILPGPQKDPIVHNIDFKHVSLFIDSVCASCGGSGL